MALTFMLLYLLVIGLIPHFFLINQGAVTSRYFRWHGLGSLLLLIPAVALVPSQLRVTLTIATFLLIGYLLAGKRVTLSRISLAFAFVYALYNIWRESQLVGFFTITQSGLLLGTTLGALCLGHWYLNVPKLPISELKKVVWLLIAIILVRDLFAGFFILTLMDGLNWGSTQGLFLLMRIMWGLVAPTILSYFLMETVKISSTQSATGLLYVNFIMVLIGEIMSLYLHFVHGITS